MDDAAARGHQVARAGADRRMGAQIVAMVDRAFEQIGYGGEIDVRMRPHVHSLPDVEMRRAELVDEDEGADHRAGFVGQGSPHVEGADIVGRRGDNLHRHSPGASVLIASAWTRWPGRSPSALFTARWRATRFCPAKPAHALVRLTCDSPLRSDEQTSELQSRMRIYDAVSFLKNKTQ